MQTGLSATWCKRRACVDCHLRPALRALDWVGMDRKPALLTDDQDPAAMPILFCLVQDEDEAVQIAVGYALDRLEPTSRETVPLLVTALKDQHPAVRYWAATLLGRLGEKAKTAV